MPSIEAQVTGLWTMTSGWLKDFSGEVVGGEFGDVIVCIEINRG
jgi:hypothetical protein